MTKDDNDRHEKPDHAANTPAIPWKKRSTRSTARTWNPKGWVVDLSRGGMSLQYESDPEKADASWEEVEVINGEDGRSLFKAACEKVYDQPVVENGPFAGVFSLRRCAVRFTELSNEQQNQLDLILHQFTSGRS